MAFEPVYELARADWNRKMCSGQAVVEARLLPREGGIAKVLTTSCDLSVNITEVFTGEARYNGRVNFKVLYVDPDGVNHSLDYNADFSDKIMCDNIKTGLKASLKGRILDTDIVSVSEGEIKLAAVAEIDMYAAMSESFKYLAGGGENIYTSDERIDYCVLNAEAEADFTLSDHMADVKICKILVHDSKLVILKRTAGVDMITVEGVVICDVCGETADGLIASYRFETPFSQEISALNSHPDNSVVASARITSCRVDFEGDANSNNLAIEYNISVRALIYGDAVINAIADAFAVRNELLQSGESVEICRNKMCATVTDRVEGSVTLDVNMPIVDNIMAATAAKLNLTNAYAMEGKVTLEGVVGASIIYYCAENTSKNSVSVELPFSITVAADVDDGDAITACGEVTNVAVKIRRGNELDIKADIAVELCAVKTDTKYIITDLKLGEELPLPEGAVSIHIAKQKETLWDVAKALGTTPELVLLQNPTLTLPLSGGERVLSYRHLTK